MTGGSGSHFLGLVSAFCVIVSFITCFALCYPLTRLLELSGITDKPNHRSSHTTIVPRGGGIGIVVGLGVAPIVEVWLGSSFELASIYCGVAVLCIIGLLDDKYSLPASFRLLLQLVAGAWISWRVARATPFQGIPGDWAGVLNVPITVACGAVVLAGYSNSFNFMDGINGISASQGIATGFGGIVLLVAGGAGFGEPLIWLLSVLGGVCVGFLPHNFPKARLFLGDCGSVPMGMLIASCWLIAMRDLGPSAAAVLVLLQANYILDTGITLFRRVIRGDRWYEPHREHFYQRLVRSGKSHQFTTGMCALLQVVCILVLLLLTPLNLSRATVACAIVIVIWICFFLYCESRFTSSQALLKNGAEDSRVAS